MKRGSSGAFGDPIIIHPISSVHEITIVFLHGRGWTAAKFHDSVFAIPLPHYSSLRDAIPNARFVFPAAPKSRASKYKRSLIHQWYDGTGDWEPEARGGMRDSVEYIHSLLREESSLLSDDCGRIVLAGFSQGGAMALTSFLLWDGKPLKAVVSMCGFMPLNSHLITILDGPSEKAPLQDDVDIVFEFDSPGTENDTEPHRIEPPLQQVVAALREEVELPGKPSTLPLSFQKTPVFLGHGKKDLEVDIQHGRQACELLQKMDVSVQLQVYPQLGHELSSIMIDSAAAFIRNLI